MRSVAIEFITALAEPATDLPTDRILSGRLGLPQEHLRVWIDALRHCGVVHLAGYWDSDWFVDLVEGLDVGGAIRKARAAGLVLDEQLGRVPMSREGAEQVATEYLNGFVGTACGIVPVHAIESRCYWYLTWNTRLAIETQGHHGRLVGFGPVAVEKATSAARLLPPDPLGPLGGSIEPLLPASARVTTAEQAHARAQRHVDVASEYPRTVAIWREVDRGWVFVVEADELLRVGVPSTPVSWADAIVVERATGRCVPLGWYYPMAERLRMLDDDDEESGAAAAS